MYSIKGLLIFGLLSLISGCKKDPFLDKITVVSSKPTPYFLVLPKSFPQMTIPKSNPLTFEGIALGKRLFYDPLLSGNNKLACASCHQQNASFVDSNKRFSLGVTGVLGGRNSMPIFNLGYASAWFWDGRAKTLEEQVFHPITSQNEMNQDLSLLMNEISSDASYIKMYNAAFGKGEITFDKTSKAIAQFMRIIIAYPNKIFDTSASNRTLNASEKRGLKVFLDENKGDCFHCHELGNFMTNYKFANNGLNINSINDPGLYAVTRNPEDLGKFKTPALLNIKFTAPYMHDGRFKTLREVIEFYDNGFKFHPQTNYYLDVNLKKHFDLSTNKPTPRTWTEQDKQDLITFIEGLVDESVNTNPSYTK